MSNNDDPFGPRNGTVMRPRPGAGRRSSADPFISSANVAPAPERRADPSPVQLEEFSGGNNNPLVQAATPLLALTGRLRVTRAHPDVAGLRRQVLDEIRRFEDRARAAGVASETVGAARYCLCAALDEAVLGTPWGTQSEWAVQTLLVQLHRDTRGGEKFFAMLDSIRNDPTRHIDLTELQHACIALGFNGKFQVLERGSGQLEDIRHEVFRGIRAFRGAPEAELSPHWRGVEDRRNPIIRYVPWWVVGALALVVLTGAFVYYHTSLGALAAPIDSRLASIGLSDFTAPVAATPSMAPRLKPLLSAAEARGVLQIEENGRRTIITLTAPDLFASGSTKVNPMYFELLQDVSHALDQVPGRVMVVGHTDDVPLRSLRYRDNYELSRERAVQVVELLKPAIADPARLEWTGVGSSQPRYRPESTPENRARNRRVEIIHVAGG